MTHESIFIPHHGDQLHLKHIHENGAAKAPALLLHGAIENGRIFYSEDGQKGLAPFLARNGFDTYIADLRGRGLSSPPISRKSRFGQNESILEELPAFISAIQARNPEPQHWIAHSWGGVLMLSYLARFPEAVKHVRSLTFFGTKRAIHVWHLDRFLKISVFWNTIARIQARIYGYVPAKQYGWGADNESDLSHWESKQWVKPGPWVDPRDYFDYGAKAKQTKFPPALFLTGTNDHTLGNIKDVTILMNECGFDPKTQQKLLRGYDHISMLTHPDAAKDHFPEVAKWLSEN